LDLCADDRALSIGWRNRDLANRQRLAINLYVTIEADIIIFVAAGGHREERKEPE
jgi:hypothetical protein